MHKRVKENIGRYWFGKGRRQRDSTGQDRAGLDSMGHGSSTLGKDIHLQNIHPRPR